MRDRIQQKQEYRLVLLQCLYEALDGDEGSHISKHPVYALAKQRGIPEDEIRPAWSWLEGEGLARHMTNVHVKITHEGVSEVEAAATRPEDGTEYFPAAVIHQVQNFYGPVGAAQTGNNNTANVMQNVASPELFQRLAELRAAADQLPEETRDDAIVLIDAIEAQAKTEKPARVLVDAYAEKLKLLLPMAQVIQIVVNLILAVRGAT